MNIILITLSTPTFNNTRAASALPYHLIKGYASKAKFDVYSYNINDIDRNGIEKTEKELNIKIHILERPWWMEWMFKLHLGILRILLSRPYLSYLKIGAGIVCKVKSSHPDLVWIYGEELAQLASHFKGSKCIVTMPDCESMFYYRMLKLNWNTESITSTLKYAFAYWQYRNMERKFYIPEVTYHFVGKEDADFYGKINPGANVIFLPHPLYAYNENKKIEFHQPKIKLLFAGRYDFYCNHSTDDLLSTFLEHAGDLKEHYEVTFLGKGWTNWNEKLIEAGFTSWHIDFAPDYIEELQKHDIQINAIDVGTGTKGKVLDALANGLLMLGTPYALENIAVEHRKSCFICQTSIDFVTVLKGVAIDKTTAEKITINGQESVIKKHSVFKVAQLLFENHLQY